MMELIEDNSRFWEESAQVAIAEELSFDNSDEDNFNLTTTDDDAWETDDDPSIDEDVLAGFHDLACGTARCSYSIELKNPRRHEKVIWK
ncbi:MAG: hypothetical protein JW738_07590 [Actinobacteria bacterium]|nr:hypothetical protein [Actinomycetota bacterium]